MLYVHFPMIKTVDFFFLKKNLHIKTLETLYSHIVCMSAKFTCQIYKAL